MNAYEINSPKIVAEILDGEILVIDFELGVYFSMSDSAAAIWTLLVAHQPMSEIVAQLELHLPQASDLVPAFVQELEQHHLIRPADAAPISVDLKVFGISEAPKLEVFRDMEHMLLLDPIHDVEPTKGWPFKTRSA